jgi:hypothetical protein
MAGFMTQTGMTRYDDPGMEGILRNELTRGDSIIDSAAPILRHLLANDDHSLFGDEVVARVRGMVGHLSDQMLLAQAQAAQVDEIETYLAGHRDELSAQLINNPALLAHLHGLALEWQLTERLQGRAGIDAVLPPLLQALIASPDRTVAAVAMAKLAAQARFIQQVRRMEQPLCELPGDLFHVALLTMRNCAGEDEQAIAESAEASLRATFDESRSRLGLASRLVTSMGGGAVAALSVAHAGVAIFLTALAIASGQSRESATMATNERQLARLALSLSAAGLKPTSVEQQFALFHPEICLPEGFDQLRPDRAAAILVMSAPALTG